MLWLYHLYIQLKNCPLPSHLNTNTHKTNISEHTNSAGKKRNKIFFLVHISYHIFHQVLFPRRCHHLICVTTGWLWTVTLQYWPRFLWKTVGGPLMHSSFADHLRLVSSLNTPCSCSSCEDQSKITSSTGLDDDDLWFVPQWTALPLAQLLINFVNFKFVWCFLGVVDSQDFP